MSARAVISTIWDNQWKFLFLLLLSVNLYLLVGVLDLIWLIRVFSDTIVVVLLCPGLST